MGMSIQTNPGAEFAAIAAKRAADMMDTAMIRLSSGKRINSAKDDAAGIQVAIRMEAEVNGLASLYEMLVMLRPPLTPRKGIS